MDELAVVREDHVVIGCVDPPGDGLLAAVRAHECQSAQALIDSSEGAPSRGQGIERCDEVPLHKRTQIAEVMLGAR